MLGKRYLDTRVGLAEVLDAVKSLAFQTQVDYHELEHEDMGICLTSPFRIVVAGESESGKTSFLNALLGINLIEDDEYPIYVYGSARIWSGGESPFVKYTQIQTLSEVEIVDNRGISKLTVDERDYLKELMEEADHVFYVMSAENPWAAKSWDFVTESREQVGKRCSVILQKTDILKKRDIEVLVGHLTSLSIQRVGHALQIHCISAIAGVASWGKQKRDGRAWLHSGYKELEAYLNEQLNGGEERRGALQYVSRKVKQVIDRIESSIEGKMGVLRSDTNSLKIVEAEVERAREGEVENAKIGLLQMASVITEQIEPAVKYASKKNGFFSTLIAVFSRGDGALEVEKQLQLDVSGAAFERAREIAFSLLAKCEHQWRGMRDDLQKRMAVTVVGFDSKMFEKNVEKFSDQMQHQTKRTMMMLKLSRLLDRMMVARQRALKKMLCWLLLLVSAAGFTGYMELNFFAELPWLILVIATGLFFYMLYFGSKTKSALLLAYSERLHNARFEFSEMMQEPYSTEMREFYTGYTSMFENLRQYIVSSEERLVPMHDKWHALFLRYKAVDQGI